MSPHLHTTTIFRNISNQFTKVKHFHALIVSPHLLQQHVKSVHKGVTFPCEDCEYKATQKSNLQTHIKSTHKGVMLSCPDCDYYATTKSNLQKHNKLVHKHKGEILFPCPECGSIFTQKGNLKTHTKSIHKNGGGGLHSRLAY